jgi:protein-tyrosine kinase
MLMDKLPPNADSNASPDKPIGDIIRESHNLSADQVQKVLEYQRESGLKFGEAAVALGMIKREHVLWALSQQFSYPYSSEVAQVPELVMSRSPFSEYAECFRELRSQLNASVFARSEGRPRALAVLSPDVGDGKSYFAANLAVAFSQLPGRTVLVDADMRGGRLHNLFGIQVEAGLSSALVGRSEIKVVRPLPELPNLFVLPVGVVPPNPLELVERPTFAMVLDDLRAQFDYVIVDTPAAVHGADSRVIAAACGAALIIGRRGRSRMSAMRKLVDGVKKLRAEVAGVVINEHQA